MRIAVMIISLVLMMIIGFQWFVSYGLGSMASHENTGLESSLSKQVQEGGVVWMIIAAWIQATATILLLGVTRWYACLTRILTRRTIQPAVLIISTEVFIREANWLPGIRLGNYGSGPARNIRISVKWNGIDVEKAGTLGLSRTGKPQWDAFELKGKVRWALPPGQEVVYFFFQGKISDSCPSSWDNTRVEWIMCDTVPETPVIWDIEPESVEIHCLDIEGCSYQSSS